MKQITTTGKNTGAFLLLVLSLIMPGCRKALVLKEPAHDPVAVFDEAWQVIDQHYALFPVKGISWDSVYKAYRPQVNNGLTDAALFNIVSHMLESLKDGHVTLFSQNSVDTYDGFYTAFPANFNYNNVLNNYLNKDYTTSGPLIYKIVDNVGYVYYASFSDNITDVQVNAVFNAVQNTRGLIIDVRNNTGGQSENADRIFSRLISQKTLAGYELAKKGTGHNEFADPRPHYIEPSGTYYSKPVCVLTNRKCFSTCNDFISYAAMLPSVTLIGDQSGGGGGIPDDYILANGWKLQYTSTMTLSAAKLPLENGIKPNISINITPVQDMHGQDPILDRAFTLLK